MAKFKVTFKGFAFIEADDERETQEKLEDEDYAYLEYEIDSVEEVDEFIITM